MLNIDKRFESLPWLSVIKARLAQQLAANQLPHALLIHGLAGTGRRELALWLAEELLQTRLDLAPAAEQGATQPRPDLLLIEPPDGKFVIPVNTVRDAVTPFLSLTSHGSGRRIAIIYPAEGLARSAANALLKTLEEPPADCLIILIALQPGRVPATVRSRCQLLHIPPPPHSQAVEWLAAQKPGRDFAALLELCGNAPLAALEMETSGAANFANELIRRLMGLERGQAEALDIADFAAQEPDLALNLLEWRLADRIRAGLTSVPATPVQARFRKLDQIRELRRVINGGIKAELSFAGLLLDW